MGLFQTLKIFFRLMKDAPKVIKALEQQRSEFIAMTTEELSVLQDDALFSAAVARVEAYMDHEAQEESFAALSLPQKVLYAVNCLEMEVNNGGLCQFFVNSSRMFAPYISEYLGIIGADAHKQLFDDFINRHGINLSDLSSFQIHRIEDYENQTKRYPFDEYDDAFYQLPSLEEVLTSYIKANLSFF